MSDPIPMRPQPVLTRDGMESSRQGFVVPKATPNDLLQQLSERKKGLITYAKMKIDAEDWHGVADAMMDVREVDAQIQLLFKL